VAWPVRRRQLMRWVTGHTECMHKFWRDLLLARSLTVSEKADALFMLACYWTAPIMVLGWAASLLLFLLPGGHLVPGLQVAIAFVSYQAFGNSATFFEIGAAALLDNNSNRVLLLPLNLFCYFASTGAICSALLRYYLGGFWGWGTRRWHKTTRTRTNGQNGNGNGHGPGRNGGSNHNHSLLLRTSNGMYVARTETP